MTNKQKELYDKIVATGRYTEEQLAKIRAGFEKKPRKINIKKSELHFDKAMSCLQLEKIDPTITVDWPPENEYGDAFIHIVVPNGHIFSASAKSILLDAMKAADSVAHVYTDLGMVVITLGFLGIIQDPNKSDNFTAN